ncbi:MAG: hypothetical protein AVDCRST_MAG56-7364, partial [uncultured Cytophagales bacterium]
AGGTASPARTNPHPDGGPQKGRFVRREPPAYPGPPGRRGGWRV